LSACPLLLFYYFSDPVFQKPPACFPLPPPTSKLPASCRQVKSEMWATNCNIYNIINYIKLRLLIILVLSIALRLLIVLILYIYRIAILKFSAQNLHADWQAGRFVANCLDFAVKLGGT
jgi:hypothetical protein